MTNNIVTTFAEIVTALYAEFIKAEAVKLGLVIDDAIARMIARGCPTIAGSSGGKDSDVLVILLNKLYQAVGYTGERVVVHADMGLIEHAESLGQVHALAAHVGWKVKVVRRKAGDLVQRYEQRWRDNVARYVNLECVTLISPWPSKNALFCRSEVKVSPIMQEAVRMFPGQAIINAVGLRREESDDRAMSPVSKENDGLVRANGTSGRDWFPILDILIERIWLIHLEEKFRWHVQYDRGNERLSCAWCWLGVRDWKHGVKVETNHPSFIRMSALEIASGCPYAAEHWLCDEAPEVLPAELREQIESAKRKGELRRQAELGIPKELLFKNHGGRRGWPDSQPSMEQCELLARVRREVGEVMGLELRYTTAQDIYDRYGELLAEKAGRDKKKARAEARRLEGRTVKGKRSKRRRIPVTSNIQGEDVGAVVAASVVHQPALTGYQQQAFAF
jgi:3'-phosphoadenosine 5'-phosphosulfate sulfotransferase (PAPS reductase)/FAD synthetase